MGLLREEVEVLVVDDVNALRVNLKELLKSFGFRKITAVSNGAEAEQVLQAQPVHLVLCDWHMTPISGFDLLKKMRADAKLKDIPFIMVTAENTKESVMAAIQSGIDDYLVKPLTLDKIRDKVVTVLLKKKVL